MRLLNLLIGIVILILFFSCKKEIPESGGLKTGLWRGEILAQNNRIPFNFEVLKNDGVFTIYLINGEEKFLINGVNVFGDSLFFDMHIFDVSIKAKLKDSILTGLYIKNYANNYELPFKAVYNKKGRFDQVNSNHKFDGIWETTFKSKEGKETPAIGIFKTKKNILNGTFLLKTGDYRFLDGYTKQDTMFLYSFDGNHIFKFRAERINDTILKGEFWSGKTGYKTFISKKNDQIKLPDANKLTLLKENFDKIEFSFPDLNENQVSLNDEKYKDKVVILQIFGTWCPNCMDETVFLSEWYRKNHSKGVEIIGLAYENKDEFEYAKKRVKIMKENLNANYDFVIAGTSSTKSASESLPMLNKVISFPTAIIIDKKGEVRRIHTGFSGPATGIYYEEFVDDFNQFLNKLLEEKIN